MAKTNLQVLQILQKILLEHIVNFLIQLSLPQNHFGIST